MEGEQEKEVGKKIETEQKQEQKRRGEKKDG